MFCTKCGFEIKDGYKFCPKCGTPAYVEQENPKSGVKKEEVDEVAKDIKNESMDELVSTTGRNEANDKEAETKSKKADYFLHDDYISNSLIEKELDIEGVKSMADQGNKVAMLRQAFRYEVGIGTQKNLEKARRLYDLMEEKDVVFHLENAHINHIIPDITYDSAFLPSYDEDENEGVYLKVIPFVKDLLLNFAVKVESDKNLGIYSKKKVENYKSEFYQELNKIRLQYPEFFLHFNTTDKLISDEEDLNILERIKVNAAKRYSLKWIPSLFNFIDYIDSEKICIPSIYQICSDGGFVLYYETAEMKQQLLNQFLVSVLIQIPVGKIKLNIVDLSQHFEASFLINSLNSKILHGNPIVSTDALEKLIRRIEKRTIDVEKKYGHYSRYCEEHHCIPIPYELIVLVDDLYKPEYAAEFEAINAISSSVGVYVVQFEKRNNLFYDNDIYDSKSNIVLTKHKSASNAIVSNGLLYKTVISDKTSTPAKNAIQFRTSLPKGKHYSFLATGDGNYEVILKPRFFSVSYKNYNKNHYNKLKKLFKFTEDDFSRFLERKEDLTVKAFATIIEAQEYIKDLGKEFGLNFPLDFNPQFICLLPCVRGILNIKLGVALFIPENLIKILGNYKEDLTFYFNLLGWDNTFIVQILNYISSNKVYTSDNNDGKDSFVSTFIDTETLWMNNDFSRSEYSINSINYKGLFIRCPDIFNLRFGIAMGDKKDRDSIILCQKLILEKETELIKAATNKWGSAYAQRHLCFNGELLLLLLNGFYFSIETKRHYKLPILEYTQSLVDTKLSEKNKYSPYIKYFESEIKEIENMYENDLSSINIPVGKTELIDVVFCLDLVSHVHSFIIGQSGSGKSVFLHNIIGGAMMKYAPEDLQLYLLDFKLGGVEFNRYQGAKHVKALLVDNSDPQVTLEILRELRNSMTERGKLLRSAGVNNIGEYNKLHQEDRMPHVLVVADECHEMFKADDSIPRQVRNEISDIVIKIAKEGRSQGVHLVFATQTLSGTEISSEIINNVSDFYLLKCAQTDSERLVPNSSAITSELSTGQIYYHHVDEQVKFQAYYTDKEAAEKLMAAIVEKAKEHKSNGEFYFNGAQMFYLDEAVKEQIQNVKGKSPVAFMGKAIDISQKDLYIKLNEDFSENVLLLGLNDQEQVTRTTMNLFVSLMISAKLKHKDITFKVIDCLNNEEGDVHELIFDLENEGLCEIIERRQRSKFFKDLAQGVLDGTAEETILLILGQDRFRELKMDMELEDDNNSSDDALRTSEVFFGGGGSTPSNVRTYKDALSVIVDKGPDYGVHTLLQLEKVSNLLYMDLSPKEVFQKFKHFVLLKSPENEGQKLYLNDDIHLEKLSCDWERLRAYYYAEESDSYTLFTPYMTSKSKDIINLLKTI